MGVCFCICFMHMFSVMHWESQQCTLTARDVFYSFFSLSVLISCQLSFFSRIHIQFNTHTYVRFWVLVSVLSLFLVWPVFLVFLVCFSVLTLLPVLLWKSVLVEFFFTSFCSSTWLSAPASRLFLGLCKSCLFPLLCCFVCFHCFSIPLDLVPVMTCFHPVPLGSFSSACHHLLLVFALTLLVCWCSLVFISFWTHLPWQSFLFCCSE